MYSNTQNQQGPFSPKITVIGVGGAGGNAVNNMIASKLEGVNFMVCNTDAQALENSLASKKIQLGTTATGGLGAGARPEIGRTAAEETMEEVMGELDGSNMVFITAGMGGGTGTGAAPVIAREAKERGMLTVGVVTKPFQFEGAQRMRLAEAGIEEMAQYVDTLIVIPNQNLFRIANEKTTFADAFRMADNVLQSGVRGVTDLMVVPGLINLDFADVRSSMSEMGKAMMGTGEATGDRRAIEAAEQAINNPLLDDVSMKGARSVIINITGGHDLTLFEIEEACNRINDEVDPDATIIFGSTYDDSLDGTMRITVVATGIDAEINRRAASARTARPMAATIPQKQVENETSQVTDNFVARYPEPTRPAAATSSNAARPVSGSQVQPSHSAEPKAPTVTPSYVSAPAVADQAAVASAEPMAPAVTETAPVQESQNQGHVETDYVTEGSAVRKVETYNYNQDVEMASSPQTSIPQPGESLIPPSAPARKEEAAADNKIVLTPPSTPASVPQQKKTPSLFERITGSRSRNETQDEQADEGKSTSSSDSSSFPFSGLKAERKTVATSYDAPVAPGTQGTLNVDPTPQKKPGAAASGDDLDIPAFLRRQIS